MLGVRGRAGEGWDNEGVPWLMCADGPGGVFLGGEEG